MKFAWWRALNEFFSVGNSSLDPLRAYEGEDIEIQLPGSLQVYDIDWLAVWCVKFSHNFGHVMVPNDLDVPPSLGQTKISVSKYKFKRKQSLWPYSSSFFMTLWVIMQSPLSSFCKYIAYNLCQIKVFKFVFSTFLFSRIFRMIYQLIWKIERKKIFDFTLLRISPPGGTFR